MRKLKTSDAIEISKLIRKADIKKEVSEIINGPKSLNQEELGIELMLTLLDAGATSGVDKEIYKLMASITGKTADDIAEQPLEDTISDLLQIKKENDLSGFLGFVGKLPLK